MQTTHIPSFFDPVDDAQREPMLQAYLDFLVQRDGPVQPGTGMLPKREVALAAMNNTSIHYSGALSQADFDRLYSHFTASAPELSRTLLLLLLFCKMNAGEAYGVRVVKRVHAKEFQNPRDLPTRVIQFAQEEEEYHTRILVGAARHFNISAQGAYYPPAALKVLIGGLAYAPKPLFHPILFGAEVAGVYVFNWTLHRIPDMIKDQPELADALEERLTEVLIDEVGHVTLNRLVLGERGRKMGQSLAAQTVRGMPMITPELKPVGFDDQLLLDFARFDFRDLPEEVRRKGFFA